MTKTMDKGTLSRAKVEHIKVNYGPYYEKWKNLVNDERDTFCNQYEMWLEAFEEMSVIFDSFIWQAVCEDFRKQEKEFLIVIEQYCA